MAIVYMFGAEVGEYPKWAAFNVVRKNGGHVVDAVTGEILLSVDEITGEVTYRAA